MSLYGKRAPEGERGCQSTALAATFHADVDAVRGDGRDVPRTHRVAHLKRQPQHVCEQRNPLAAATPGPPAQEPELNLGLRF